MSDSEQTVNGIGTALADFLITYKDAYALLATP